jgi:hypothetical protein
MPVLKRCTLGIAVGAAALGGLGLGLTGTASASAAALPSSGDAYGRVYTSTNARSGN